ncbi:hypothetical protein MTO96_011211 [Rhipicephalus appendiculatus]
MKDGLGKGLPPRSRLLRCYRLEIQRLVSRNQTYRRAACFRTTGEKVYMYVNSGVSWRTRRLPGSVASSVVPVLVCSARLCPRVSQGCWIIQAILRGSFSSRVRSARCPVDQPATLHLATSQLPVMAHYRSPCLGSTRQGAKRCSRHQHWTHRLAQRGYRTLRKTTPDCSQARQASGPRGRRTPPGVLLTASGRDRNLDPVCKRVVKPSTWVNLPRATWSLQLRRKRHCFALLQRMRSSTLAYASTAGRDLQKPPEATFSLLLATFADGRES